MEPFMELSGLRAVGHRETSPSAGFAERAHTIVHRSDFNAWTLAAVEAPDLFVDDVCTLFAGLQ
jgi:hypothetical protein